MGKTVRWVKIYFLNCRLNKATTCSIHFIRINIYICSNDNTNNKPEFCLLIGTMKTLVILFQPLKKTMSLTVNPHFDLNSDICSELEGSVTPEIISNKSGSVVSVPNVDRCFVITAKIH